MATATYPRPPGLTNGDSVSRQQMPINGIARAPSTRRRQSSGANGAAVGYQNGYEYVPAAPEAPPPNGSAPAYRNDGARSFSARTRDLPPEREFTQLEDVFDSHAMPQDSSVADTRTNNGRRSSAHPYSKSGPSVSIPSGSSTQAQYPRRPSDAISPLEETSQASPISRSGTMRSARGERRDWAPDRSPLQQLEVKLNDISKEEKRARVLEAEMRLKEQIARRENGGHNNRDHATSSERLQSSKGYRPEPLAAGDTALDRSSSSKQRDTFHHSGTMNSKRPESQTVSAGGPGGINYKQQQYAARPTVTSRGSIPSDVRYAEVQPARQPEYAFPEGYNQGTSRSSGGPSTTYHTRAYSADSAVNNGPLREANSSHKAVLGDPSVPAAINAAGPQRTNSKRLQKAPPRDYGDYHRVTYGQHQDHSTTPDASAAESDTAPIGLGLTRGVDGQQAPGHYNGEIDGKPQSKPKRQTVSFDMPPPTPPPLLEWKQAPVARLRAPDMDFQDIDVERSKAWWESGGSSNRRRSRALPTDYQKPAPKVNEKNNRFQPALFLKCGPLLRYTGMKRDQIDRPDGPIELETWRGSVMIVTKDSLSSYDPPPTLRLFSQPMDLLPPPPVEVSGEEGAQLAPEYVDPTAGLTKVGRDGRLLYVKPVEHVNEEVDLSLIESDDGLFEQSRSPIDYDGQAPPVPSGRIHSTDGETTGRYREIKGIRLYADSARDATFWRFNIEVELGDKQERIAYRINQGPATGFWVPAKGQSMNIMFHTCNGFSLSVDPNKFSGPDPLWRDVLTEHQTRPFHVMIGGGDQIYNDKVMLETKLFQEWTHIKNPHDKHHTPFSAEMKAELESFYLERYCMWFSQGLFGLANSQIPMINIWDDHDIIDGYGSYPDYFMRTPVFSGLGNVAFKYYMLFQHQSVPEETEADEPSWILGAEPGPYIKEKSRSLFMFLGKGVAFLGLDCRTERMKDDVLSEQTYDRIWDRCHREIVKGDTKHLIVLLGVPVAYPRLVWLENLLTSRLLDPVKALGRAGMFGHLINKFDGSVEILDDLDDHWTAKHHKIERTWLVEDLQDLAAEKSVRITILSGDVHLAAIGQFYSNPLLNLAKDKDYRYMPNIISSAIVNTPPPDMLADVLNKRNKIHHMDSNTDEAMVPIFTHDVDDKPRNNKRLMPKRNWCSIREYQPGFTPASSPEPPTPATPQTPPGKLKRTLSLTRGDGAPGGLLRRLSLRGGPPPTKEFNLDGSVRRQSSMDVPHQPPETADSYFPQPQQPRPGRFHRRPTNLSEKAAKKAAEGYDGVEAYVNLEGGLDVTLHVEISPKDPAGITRPYKLLVPALWYEGGYDPHPTRVPKGWKKWLGIRKKKDSSYEEDGATSEEGDEEGYDGYSGSEDDAPSPGAQAGAAGPPHDGDGEGAGEAPDRPKKKKWFSRG